MARGRFISESVATDARLNSLSVEAELVYLMAIPHLDRDGLIEGDPDVLWGRVCVKRRAFLDTMPIFIQEWAKAGLVTMYDTDEGPVLWFKGFAKNQVGMRYDREAASKFPPPPGYTRDEAGMIPVPAPTPEPPPPDEVPAAPQSSADELRQNSGEGVAQEQGQVEVKDQVEDQAAARARDAAAASPQEDLSPRVLIADLRARKFMYFDRDATTIAARLIADYSWPRIMEAADTMEERNQEKIANGDRAIGAPLAYLRSVLSGEMERVEARVNRSGGDYAPQHRRSSKVAGSMAALDQYEEIRLRHGVST